MKLTLLYKKVKTKTCAILEYFLSESPRVGDLGASIQAKSITSKCLSSRARVQLVLASSLLIHYPYIHLQAYFQMAVSERSEYMLKVVL
jgi:hypothetical protein